MCHPRPLRSFGYAVGELTAADARAPQVLARQKLVWMTYASQYSTPVGAVVGLYLANHLQGLLDRLAIKWGPSTVDGGAITLLVAAVLFIIRRR